MRGQSIGLLALALALSAALVLSGCGGGGGDGSGGGSPRIVYVYDADTTTADGFGQLLEGEGYDFSTVQKASVEATDFRAYDLIIVSHDSLAGSTWGTEEQAAALFSSGRPVIGLGQGGAYYFGQVGLAMGHPNTNGYKINSVYIVDGNYPIWSDVGTTGQTVALYDTPADQMNWTRCVYEPNMTPLVTLIGRHPDQASYYSLAQCGNCFYWAYPGPVSEMTEAGKKVFLNVVELMI